MKRARVRSLAVVVVVAIFALAAIARAEVAQKGQQRVSFKGELTPHTLPRSSQAPVTVSVAAKISSTNAKLPPAQLQRMSIAINRYGHFDTKGLPVCQLNDIQPATTADALAVCRRSLIGEGTFSANVPLSGRSPFPSEGKLYAFNGEFNGKPAVLAHVYGTKPAPASFTLVFAVSHGKGTFGTTLKVELPKTGSEGGNITGISLNLGKTFSYRGRKRSYLTASCPAPKGFGGAVFPFAKASFAFAGGQTLSSTLTRHCGVRG
jgi:hypothetical protein